MPTWPSGCGAQTLIVARRVRLPRPIRATASSTGLDGYNGGTMLPWGGWLSVEQIFGPSLTVIRALASQKPIMIAETGCVEGGGDKAAWIRGWSRWW